MAATSSRFRNLFRSKNRKRQLNRRQRRRLFAEGLEDRRLLAVVNFIDSITTAPVTSQPLTVDAALDTVTIGATTYGSVIPPTAVSNINPSSYLWALNGTDPGSATNALLSPNITDFVGNIGGLAELDFGQNMDGETFFVFDYGTGEPITAVPLDGGGSIIPGDVATVPFNPPVWPTVATWTHNLGGTKNITGAAITFTGVSGVEGIKFTQAGFGSGSADLHAFASAPAPLPPVNYDFSTGAYSATEGDATNTSNVVTLTRDDATSAEDVDVVCSPATRPRPAATFRQVR